MRKMPATVPLGNRLFPKMPRTEKEITREIRAYLRLRGVFHWKQHQGLGSYPGVSDILGCYRGRLLAIEVKAPKGHLSVKQRAFLERVQAEGGIAVVARSVEEVMKALDQI